MDSEFILHIGKRGLETALLLAAPVLIVTLVVGFGTAMLQAITSIRDMTMGLVLKLAFVGITLLLSGSWMMQVAERFTLDVFNYMQTMGH
jgi:flagellar biosynthetic protein FliQ